MARDVNKRLEQLAKRRKGTDRLGDLNYAEQAEVINKSILDESWQKRALDKPNTRYALGAMQAVDPDYTRISLETAERVGNQLLSRLEGQGLFVELRIKGSVALDVHIRGVSDVDLLTLDKYFYSYNRFGPKSGSYSGTGTTESALSRCLKCGHVRPTLRFSGRPCTHGFPRGHGLASMGSNLCCGAVGLGWDEEVSDGREDRHEMLQ